MTALVSKTIGQHSKGLIGSALISVLFSFVFLSFFPAVQDQAAELSQLIQSYPQEFLQAFNVDASQMFFNPEAFLAAEYFSLIWPILLIIMMLNMGAAAISGEIEDGTIELQLAQPQSRTEFFAAKYIAGVLQLILFIAISLGGILLSGMLFDLELNNESYVLIGMLSFYFGLAIYSLSITVSSLSSSRGNVMGSMGIFIILMYGINIFATIQENVEQLKYASFFYYFDYAAALLDNQISMVSIIVFTTIIIMSSLVGVFAFNRRDITV